MRVPFSWWWVGLATVATGVSVGVYRNYAVAVPTGVAAVVFAGLAVAQSLRRHLPTSRPPPTAGPPVPMSGVRQWLGAGELGREDLVLLVDRLERRLDHPELPARTPRELSELVRLPPEEFRRYIDGRLDALEGPS